MSTTMLTISGRRAVPPTRPRSRSVRVPAWVFAITAIALAATVVLTANAAGWWATSGRAALTASGAATVDGESAGDGSGKAPLTTSDPGDVKGWMTVVEVAAAFHIDPTELYAEFGIASDTPTTTALKDLEGQPGAEFEIQALRDWLTARTG